MLAVAVNKEHSKLSQAEYAISQTIDIPGTHRPICFGTISTGWKGALLARGRAGHLRSAGSPL